MEDKLKYRDITEKIIGAAFEVHKFLGNGFQEVIYQRALAYEFMLSELTYQREIEQDIYYKLKFRYLFTIFLFFCLDAKEPMPKACPWQKSRL